VTATLTSTPTGTPTATSTASPTPTATPSSTATPTVTPTASATPLVTALPSPSATEAPLATPTPALEPLCAPTPQAGCKTPSVPQKAALTIRDRPVDKYDTLVWQWLKGAPTTKSEFGAPDVATDYALCVYEAGAPQRLVLSADVPAGGMCGRSRLRPCWKATRTGFRYRDGDGGADGVRSILLQEGLENGRAKVALTAKGAALAVPSLVSLVPPLTVQLVNGAGRCWEAVYSVPAQFEASTFRGKADPTRMPRPRRTPG
jgi:hypothetical protein